MALTDIWKSSRPLLEQKQLQQIIAIAGDGRLGDGNVACKEFRELLAHVGSPDLIRFADDALIGKFEGSGFALQDIVNEVGKRLGFTVDAGRYRGVQGQIGFDGLWTTRVGHSLVIEVKTTDAYRIDLNTVADYRKNLIRSAKISEESSSILIVVARQDTGDLEAQIRGSRHAWDIRLISVDALLRLLRVKEAVDDPAIAQKIAQILIPREYTRVDSIIDVVFSAAEEEKRNLDLDGDDESANPAAKKFTPVNFHEACAARVEQRLKQPLIKQTRSTYASPDAELRVLCSISRVYESGTGQRYWFAYHPYYDDFLQSREKSYVSFGCGSADNVLLIPYNEFRPLMEGFNITQTDDGHYRHVKIFESGGRVILNRKTGFSPVDLTKYRI